MDSRQNRLLLFSALWLALTMTLSACGGSKAELDAALLRLELRYPVAGQPDLRVTGQAASAPSGATVSCRATGERQTLGRVAAAEDGSFQIPLAPEAYPMKQLAGDFMDLNRTLECRADSGPWVSPLRPPLVAIGSAPAAPSHDTRAASWLGAALTAV